LARDLSPHIFPLRASSPPLGRATGTRALADKPWGARVAAGGKGVGSGDAKPRAGRRGGLLGII
jgi:hypothetical protein